LFFVDGKERESVGFAMHGTGVSESSFVLCPSV
jgi:hypothetical protein